MSPRLLPALLVFAAAALHAADVKPIPPPGIVVPETDRAELTAGVAALGQEIDALRSLLEARPEMLALLPDVIIFHKAADWALRYDEFFDPKHIGYAQQQLELGLQRAKELRDGQPSWNSATGLVVRGYISKIDGSVQPYGLVIPEDWKLDKKTPRRLDFWFRGRSEKSTELAFIADRLKDKGEFAPPGAIVLHPFGRYCCANKFAGEVDLFEALENARTHYQIDPNRMSVRGFSMGGAAAWQFGTHFAGMWAAVAPGAGFAETAEFNRVFAPGKTPPPWWEQVLYRWYDATLYAANLANTTTVAYSGELDGQKQAADIMLRYAEKEGVTFPHIIGPQTAHKYHPEAKPQIEEIVTAAAEKGRDPVAKKVSFTTCSLIYPTMKWVTVTGMEKGWERADITAEDVGKGTIRVTTKNVSSFRLSNVPFGMAPGAKFQCEVDRETLNVPFSPSMDFAKEASGWIVKPTSLAKVELTQADQLASARSAQSKAAVEILSKRPGVCGPIDHAFMSSVLFVRPTGKPLHDKVGAWTQAELAHAIGFWRKVFRGDVRVKDDTTITAEDAANSNLILWGDPSSNAVIKKLLDRLPLRWNAQELALENQPQMNTEEPGSKNPARVSAEPIGGSKTFGPAYDASQHAPIFICPNPESPRRYIVINSGPTFREEALLNNAQQIPKLPDWAIINLNTPPDARNPGEVVSAGFFDEQWKVPQK